MKTLDARHFLLDIRLSREKVPSFGEYPFSLPAISGLNRLEFHPNVTFIVGENGSGKSTLMEAIAVKIGLNPEGGSRNFHFATRESHSALHEALQIRNGLKRPRDSFFLRTESYFNLGTEIETIDRDNKEAAGSRGSYTPLILSYGGKSLHEQSHGESFFALFKNRFGGGGLYLLDEPEAALSPGRQMEFLTILNQLVVLGSQFIVATHSPIVMAYPRAWIYVLGKEGIRRTAYEETEHFQVTRDFLQRTPQMLKILMGEGADGADG